MTKEQIFSYVDHTQLKAFATWEDIVKLCDEAVEYVIETGIASPIVQNYIDGSSIRQYQFNFGSREYYSLDRVENIQNSTFYENRGGK